MKETLYVSVGELREQDRNNIELKLLHWSRNDFDSKYKMYMKVLKDIPLFKGKRVIYTTFISYSKVNLDSMKMKKVEFW